MLAQWENTLIKRDLLCAMIVLLESTKYHASKALRTVSRPTQAAFSARIVRKDTTRVPTALIIAKRVA
jgi:hypothetical protein